MVLEVSPFGENLHGLDVFNGSQLFSVIFITTESIKVELLAKSLVLMFNLLKNVVDLLTVEYLLVIHTSNRVEDGPHNFWVINSTEMISNVKAEDNLVEFSLFNSNSLIAEWWWQFSKEVRQSDGSHVELTHWVVLSPSVLECLNIFLLKSQDIVLIFSLLIIVETFTNNGNKHIHEDEE